MDADPYPLCFTILQQVNTIFNNQIDYTYIIPISLFLVFLIICSAFLSASENALFSLSQAEIEDISKQETPVSKAIIKHLSQPQKLLATILTANNLVNVTFVILSSFVLDDIFNFQQYKILEFILNVVVVTFILLLFGEVIPKVYATKKNKAIARIMALPLLFLQKIFGILVIPMVAITDSTNKWVRKREHNVSANILSHAIDITSDKNTLSEEKEILKGIVNFGNKTVTQIMRSRSEVAALDTEMSYQKLLLKIQEMGYSRFPVYEENFDNIIGVLYIKELLPYLQETDNFNWRKLVKEPFFVPDNKRIDLLLEEFQEQRMHLAIVVDEYGGKLGIVTMEDILEEIFGEINDEFDEEPLSYQKINDKCYSLEGKLLINDFCKIANIDSNTFDKVSGESQTMAGLILEAIGKLPQKNEVINILNFRFTIESVDNRRIKRIKAEIL